MLNRPLSEFYDDNIQRCREEMAITLLKHSGILYTYAIQGMLCISSYNIFLYIHS